MTHDSDALWIRSFFSAVKSFMESGSFVICTHSSTGLVTATPDTTTVDTAPHAPPPRNSISRDSETRHRALLLWATSSRRVVNRPSVSGNSLSLLLSTQSSVSDGMAVPRSYNGIQ